MQEHCALVSWLARTGLKQVEAAKRFGVSGPTFCDWKAGKGRPSLANAIKIELETDGSVPVESWGYETSSISDVLRLLARRRRAAKSRASAADPEVAT